MFTTLALTLLFASPADFKDAPANPPSLSRIAPESEPGEPLTISGTVYAPDGLTPLAGIVVYGYHTDATGLYRPDRQNDKPPRLRGWARTDANGRFEFHTIRPAPYPGRDVPAHAPRPDANDLVQDVFLRALRKIAGLRDASAFGGWLAGIARNRAREQLRRVPRGDPLPDPAARETQADQAEAAAALAAIGE